MAFCDDVRETRLLITHLPGPKNAKPENMEGCFLCLRHPKSDGGLYAATPVDPVFILLPIFEEARMKKENDHGMFRQLDEIIFVNSYPGYQHLLATAEASMEVVCEVREIGLSKFFRLDDSKVLAWLCHKVDPLKLTLTTLDRNYAARNKKDTLIDAVLLLGEYMKDDPWLKLLCDHLGLDIQEVTRKAPAHESIPSALEITPGSSTQMKLGNEKNASSNRRQSKKMKRETASQNIKDMFRKASKSKT
ncbi:uncharacterized protein LOC143861747 isoform X2 [Tasmannia lanceolata]|uniref:uncharacterized protein LOC143859584 isoform X2 n=1 Tax=Tasmannia lanceolata TaxID=3420 RepID=UPI00406288F3